MMTKRLSVLSVAIALVGGVLPSPSHSQEFTALIEQCTSAGASTPRCTELAVTALTLQEQIGLLAGLGSEVAGSAATLGKRIGSSPRTAVSVRTAFAFQHLPDLGDPGVEPSREASFLVPAAHAGLAVGVFDGFSLAPTFGGFLGVDLFASAGLLLLPTAEGFDGKAVAWALGARVGLVRESFTLPGVAISLSRRYLPAVHLGSAEGPGGGAVMVDPTVTSFRATVGKDLLAVGLIAGVGWDRYSGPATLSASTGGPDAQATTPSLTHGRPLAFGGAALNFLVLQLSGEIGWARGFDVRGYRDAPFDPKRGTVYGSVAFRLTI